MKIRVIDRKRHLTNTPILFWIRTLSYSIAGVATVYSFYFYYYKAEDYAKEFSKYTSDYFTELERKKIAKRDQPLQSNAYKEYLKEKKLYENQLEEETRVRLEKIKQRELEAIKPTISAPQTQPQQTQSQQPTDSIEIKKSKKQILLNYLTFGLWK